MYKLSIEIERKVEDGVFREEKTLQFRDRDQAEAQFEYFEDLIESRLTQFLRDGETLRIVKCSFLPGTKEEEDRVLSR